MSNNEDFAKANAAKLFKAACLPEGIAFSGNETDWRKEAQMYAECIGAVKKICEQAIQIDPFAHLRADGILAIIQQNLK